MASMGKSLGARGPASLLKSSAQLMVRQSKGGKRHHRAVGERSHGVTGAGGQGKEVGREEAFEQRGQL